MKIEIATDTRSPFQFDIQYSSFDVLKSILLTIDQLTTMKPAKYERTMIAYKDWYANELIKRISEDKAYFDQQPDAKKEVLLESLRRRNDLMERLQRTMNFYHDNKEKIDKVEKVRANYQKSFPGPLLTCTESKLIFENVTEYGDIFFQIWLDVEVEQNQDQENTGSGWMEYSLYYSDNLKSLPYSPTGVHISNTKPRSDIRVLRRGDSKPFRIFQEKPHLNHGFRVQSVAIRFQKDHHVPHIQLNKAQTFLLVDKVRRRVKNNEELNLHLTLSPTVNFGISTTSTTLNLFCQMPEQEEYQLKVNSSVFLSLIPLLHHISKLDIYILPTLFGIQFDFTFDGGGVSITSNSLIDARHRHLRSLFMDYLHLSGSKHDYSGNTGYFDDQVFKRGTHFEPLQLSRKQEKAYTLISQKYDLFTKLDERLSFTQENTTAEITKNGLEGISYSCSCGKVHEKYLCQHLIALLIFGYLEGYFDA